MRIESFKDLIEWTRARHGAMAQCLAQCAADNPDERAAMMLHYLASHEAKLERMVALFDNRTGLSQDDAEAYRTDLDDGSADAERHPECNGRFANMSAAEVQKAVFASHDQIISFYQDMINKVKKRRAAEMMQEVLDMELKEAKLLVRQTGRMDDV